MDSSVLERPKRVRNPSWKVIAGEGVKAKICNRPVPDSPSAAVLGKRSLRARSRSRDSLAPEPEKEAATSPNPADTAGSSASRGKGRGRPRAESLTRPALEEATEIGKARFIPAGPSGSRGKGRKQARAESLTRPALEATEIGQAKFIPAGPSGSRGKGRKRARARSPTREDSEKLAVFSHKQKRKRVCSSALADSPKDMDEDEESGATSTLPTHQDTADHEVIVVSDDEDMEATSLTLPTHQNAADHDVIVVSDDEDMETFEVLVERQSGGRNVFVIVDEIIEIIDDEIIDDEVIEIIDDEVMMTETSSERGIARARSRSSTRGAPVNAVEGERLEAEPAASMEATQTPPTASGSAQRTGAAVQSIGEQQPAASTEFTDKRFNIDIVVAKAGKKAYDQYMTLMQDRLPRVPVNHINEAYEKEGYYHLLCKKRCNIVAAVSFRILTEPALAEIHLVAVNANYQNTGLGSKLMDRTEAFIREKWPQTETIVMNATVEAIGFYKKKGYEEVDEEKYKEHLGSWTGVVPMERQLVNGPSGRL
ncbi:unnamed protein product [Peniophora sp. CBMAI 1063]|nr:unnamed protein product [Peniophora sp. CBMAI 1063]